MSHQVYTNLKSFLRALLVISEYEGLVTLCCITAGKSAMLVVLAIPYQIYFIYKQRNANVTCDLRLLTVSVPFVHSVMQTNQKLPSLIPMQHHGL